jgi:hypothetical protein
MQVLCPKCNQQLAGSDINVATDVAQCGRCGEVFALSTLVQTSAAVPVDPNEPPRGAWFREDFGGFTVGGTTRHAIAFFLVPFMCVWSGFSLGGIYATQIWRGKFDLFQSLFGIPFFLGTLLFGSVALMTLCGKVVVRIRDSEGMVFTGVGPIGWRRAFNWLEVKSVRVEAFASRNNQRSKIIILDGPQKLRFGSMLSEARQEFVANVLRQALASK